MLDMAQQSPFLVMTLKAACCQWALIRLGTFSNSSNLKKSSQTRSKRPSTSRALQIRSTQSSEFFTLTGRSGRYASVRSVILNTQLPTMYYPLSRLIQWQALLDRLSWDLLRTMSTHLLSGSQISQTMLMQESLKIRDSKRSNTSLRWRKTWVKRMLE